MHPGEPTPLGERLDRALLQLARIEAQLTERSGGSGDASTLIDLLASGQVELLLDLQAAGAAARRSTAELQSAVETPVTALRGLIGDLERAAVEIGRAARAGLLEISGALTEDIAPRLIEVESALTREATRQTRDVAAAVREQVAADVASAMDDVRQGLDVAQTHSSEALDALVARFEARIDAALHVVEAAEARLVTTTAAVTDALVRSQQQWETGAEKVGRALSARLTRGHDNIADAVDRAIEAISAAGQAMSTELVSSADELTARADEFTSRLTALLAARQTQDAERERRIEEGFERLAARTDQTISAVVSELRAEVAALQGRDAALQRLRADELAAALSEILPGGIRGRRLRGSIRTAADTLPAPPPPVPDPAPEARAEPVKAARPRKAQPAPPAKKKDTP